jgi:excisionase family DNA binding protein
MKSVHQTSDPSTPKVSPKQQYFPDGRRTDGAIKIYPRGSAGLPYVHRSELSPTPNVSSATKDFPQISGVSLYTGIYTRIARRIGMDPSYVRRVALGLRKSSKVAAALAAEIALINKQTVLSGNGTRAQETRETKAQPATASPDNTGCGANGESSKPAPDRRAASPSSSLREDAAPLGKYIPLIEVAKALGVGRDTVTRMIKDGKLRGYRLNAKGWWRVTAESFNSYRNSLHTDLEAAS